MTQLQFDLSPLIGVRSGERLTFSLDEGPQRLDDIDAEFLRGTLQFTRIQDGILVEGEVETRLRAECVRCLEPFYLDATLEIEEIIGVGGGRRPDITYRITDEGWFNVIPLLREQAWVVVPLKPLCRSDCRGLCPLCGVNRNVEQCNCQEETINPHFAALAAFLSDGQE